MARLSAEIQLLTSTLVNQITGLDEIDPKFGRLLHHAKSNLRFHRFLTVDSTKVKRTIEGICEKFSVHAQDEKRRKFECLTNSFLTSEILTEKFPNTDSHYAILSLLLLLSNSPIHAEYKEKLDVVEEKDSESPTIDWAKELAVNTADWNLFDHADNGEDWSDSDPEMTEEISRAELASSIHLMASEHLRRQEERRKDESRVETNTETLSLDNRFVVPYWREGDDSSSADCNSLAAKWRDYQISIGQSSTNKILTEYHVLRETCWLLSGVRDLFVYEFNTSGGFSVRENIQLAHLTPGSFRSSLEPFVRAGNVLTRMRDFVSRCGADDSALRTYQGLADGLAEILQEISAKISEIEQCVNEQEIESITALSSRLHDTFRQIEAIDFVLNGSLLHKGSPARKSSHLLSSLYEAVTAFDALGLTDASTNALPLVSALFLNALRPYLFILDSWLLHGDFVDSQSEFFITKQADFSEMRNSRQYWKLAFTVSLPGNPDACVPVFLRDCLHNVVLCGKSVNLMMNVEKLRKQLRAALPELSQPSQLHSQFLHSLRIELGGDLVETSASSSAIPLRMDPFCNCTDPLLKLNFQTIFQRAQARHQKKSEETVAGVVEAVRKKSPFACLSLSLLMKNSLRRLLSDRYGKISAVFLEWFVSGCNLLSYFARLRRFYFMEAGDGLHLFATSLFTAIRNGEQWADSARLTDLLQDCLSDIEGGETLTVNVKEDDSPAPRSRIAQMKRIKISLGVPWPVDLVIDDSSLATCSNIFAFLLQIKWAKWSMDEIQYRGSQIPYTRVVHKLYLLRAKLLHFINSLSTYIMTRILHSTGVEFQAAIEKASDLDEIITLYQAYITKIYNRCLLNEKAALVRDAIQKTLSLAIQLGNMWHSKNKEIREDDITRIDGYYNKWHRFLSNFLSNLAKRGAYPHLEYLALVLNSEATRM
ncbi:gamma-tubulin complex component 5-like [Oscarella lobularis]|uniref:gamma-tubulin complex component 5-like n=1 Tax=Oscarella lobularis TaxID=121494 RepID=UPI003313E33C